MSNLTLSELAVQYENDIKILDEQIKRAKKELRAAKKESKPEYVILDLEKKIITYRDMRNECVRSARILKNYYDKSDKKRYVSHRTFYNGSGKRNPIGNGENRGARW